MDHRAFSRGIALGAAGCLLSFTLPVSSLCRSAPSLGLALHPHKLEGIHTDLVASAAEPPLGAATVMPVVSVDLQRYEGLWYEIARIPAWFQSSCVRDSTARYQQRPDGRLTVINQCLRRNGSVDRATGLARVVDPASNARLQVSFVSFLGWRPFWGDYWILGLGPEYRWAVVGDPSRRYGWILSRTPVLAPASLAEAFAVLERNGYRPGSFVLTPQSPLLSAADQRQ